MNVGSLFTGIGGWDLGLERAGMRVKWQCEADEFCRRVLAAHWPDVPCFGDVRGIHEQALRQWPSRLPVDVLCGGFPCQPVSGAGLKLAQADERWLWPEFARIVRLLRPRFVLVENVAGLLGRNRGMADVVGDLAAAGYDSEWACIRASGLGAWHARARVWIVATADADRIALWEQRGGFFGQGWPAGPPLAGLAAPETVVADADADGQLQPHGCEPYGAGRPGDASVEGAVADATLFGRGSRRDEPRGVRSSPQELADRAAALGGDWWAAEPPLARMVYGVPNGVDRRSALGNALVPQIAEWIGRRLMQSAA